MANVFLDIAKGVEVGAEDALKFLTGAQALATKLEPGVVAALGVVLGAVNTSLTAVEGAASADGLNVTLDESVVADLKTVWPAVEAFCAAIGVKF